MPPTALVLAGASAGGVEALRVLVSGLPADRDAAVLIVLHIPRESPSALPNILRRTGALPARSYGPRAAAAVLSGSGDDGTAGAETIVEAGGHVLVQDPDDALHPPMPAAHHIRTFISRLSVLGHRTGDLEGAS